MKKGIDLWYLIKYNIYDFILWGDYMGFLGELGQDKAKEIMREMLKFAFFDTIDGIDKEIPSTAYYTWNGEELRLLKPSTLTSLGILSSSSELAKHGVEIAKMSDFDFQLQKAYMPRAESLQEHYHKLMATTIGAERYLPALEHDREYQILLSHARSIRSENQNCQKKMQENEDYMTKLRKALKMWPVSAHETVNVSMFSRSMQEFVDNYFYLDNNAPNEESTM